MDVELTPGNFACWAKYALSAMAIWCQQMLLAECTYPILTLFISQKAQLIGTSCRKGKAFPVIAILENHAQAIRSGHQNLDDTTSEVTEATFY